MNAVRCSKATIDNILEAMQSEADMDGLVTSTQQYIADLVGVTWNTVNWAIGQLETDGKLVRLPQQVKNSPVYYQLTDY